MTEVDHSSRTYQLKKKLLRRAWDGRSQFSGPEMISLIMKHLNRAREMPEEHVDALTEALFDMGNARSVRALNLLEKINGSDRRFMETSKSISGSSPSIH